MALYQNRFENDGLYDLIKENLEGKHNLIGIEIGSYRGESTDIFVKSRVFSKLYCIDPWEPFYDPDDVAATPEIALAEEEFNNRFNGSDTVIKVKKKSDDAVYLFADESIDFIYIDGNHMYEFVKRDLIHYVPKIKPGGIISGHDFGNDHYGVAQAVLEYFNNQQPLHRYKDCSWVYIK